MDMWSFGDDNDVESPLEGFDVEAIDGGIGSVDEHSAEAGSRYIVVDTGPWIFGKKVLLPAGVIERIDYDEEKVFVSRTKDEIKNSPEFDEDSFDNTYRDAVGSYYAPGGVGYRESSAARR